MTAETIISFQREEYKALCEEMKHILTLEKEVAAKKEELRNKLTEMAGGDRMEYGIKVTKRFSKGSTDYKQIVADYIDPEQLEEIQDDYRKADREFWQVTSY